MLFCALYYISSHTFLDFFLFYIEAWMSITTWKSKPSGNIFPIVNFKYKKFVQSTKYIVDKYLQSQQLEKHHSGKENDLFIA